VFRPRSPSEQEERKSELLEHCCIISNRLEHPQHELFDIRQVAAGVIASVASEAKIGLQLGRAIELLIDGPVVHNEWQWYKWTVLALSGNNASMLFEILERDVGSIANIKHLTFRNVDTSYHNHEELLRKLGRLITLAHHRSNLESSRLRREQ